MSRCRNKGTQWASCYTCTSVEGPCGQIIPLNGTDISLSGLLCGLDNIHGEHPTHSRYLTHYWPLKRGKKKKKNTFTAIRLVQNTIISTQTTATAPIWFFWFQVYHPCPNTCSDPSYNINLMLLSCWKSSSRFPFLHLLWKVWSNVHSTPTTNLISHGDIPNTTLLAAFWFLKQTRHTLALETYIWRPTAWNALPFTSLTSLQWSTQIFPNHHPFLATSFNSTPVTLIYPVLPAEDQEQCLLLGGPSKVSAKWMNI